MDTQAEKKYFEMTPGLGTWRMLGWKDLALDPEGKSGVALGVGG